MFLKLNLTEGIPMPPAGLVSRSMATIASAPDGHSIWHELVACLAQHGFIGISYGFTRNRHDTTLGDPQDALFLSNQMEGDIEAWFRQPRGTGAATPKWPADYVGVRHWGDAPSSPAVQGKAGAGVTLCFPETSPREMGAMALRAEPGLSQDSVDTLWDTHGDALWALASLAHLRLSRMPLGADGRRLTDRQREVLEWVADGKTAQDIQILTGLSISGVEKHLRRVREILMVETTAHAVAKAALMNQLFLRPATPAAA